MRKFFARFNNDSIENYETTVCCKDGRNKLLSWNIRKLYDANGKYEGLIFIGMDITEKKKAEENIRYLSYHDKLTGLYNRAYFDEMIEKPFFIAISDFGNDWRFKWSEANQ